MTKNKTYGEITNPAPCAHPDCTEILAPGTYSADQNLELICRDH